MNTNKWIVLMAAGLLLIATPSWAQRRGGGGGRSGSSAPRSSMSRGTSSRSYSAPSRSYSAPSRSYSAPSRSYNTPTTRSSSSTTTATTPTRSSEPSAVQSSYSGRTPSGSTRRSGSVGSHTPSSSVREASSTRPSVTTTRPSSGGVITNESRPVHFGGQTTRPTSYAHPGRPHGPMPPSHRPIRPAPYFYHPVHHHCMHMHLVYWDPFLPSVVYWPGLWSFCAGYWVGSSCSNYTVVHEYVSNTHHVDMIAYAISGELMYALVNDAGDTYLRVFDKADNLLAQHPVHKKYRTLTIDAENGGCWIMKKNDRDPLLFLYADGELLIYESDE